MELSGYYVPNNIIAQKYCSIYNTQSVAIKSMKMRSKNALLIARYIDDDVYDYLIFNSIKIFCQYLNLLKEDEKRFYMIYSKNNLY